VSTDDPKPASQPEVSIAGQDQVRDYEVRIAGHLAARWSAWFDGLSITAEPDGTTAIRGPVADQAALHGLIQKVRDVGIPLISLTQVPPEPPTDPDHTPTRGERT
jgi:hypothetical protein